MLRISDVGFTLIELLVSIAILAIIVAIAIPTYYRYNQEAQKKAAVANARQCIIIVVAYLAESPDNNPSDAPVPDGCVLNALGTSTECTCSSPDGYFKGKCLVDSSGNVSCSEI